MMKSLFARSCWWIVPWLVFLFFVVACKITIITIISGLQGIARYEVHHILLWKLKSSENALPVLRHGVCTFGKVEKCMGTFKTQSCLALFTRDKWYSILPLRPYGGSIQSVSLASSYRQDFVRQKLCHSSSDFVQIRYNLTCTLFLAMLLSTLRVKIAVDWW